MKKGKHQKKHEKKKFERLRQRSNLQEKNRKRVSELAKRTFTQGEFCGTPHGYGFVRMNAGEDIFIPRSRTGGALDGDTVKVSYTAGREEGSLEGAVTEILAYSKKRVIGTLCSVYDEERFLTRKNSRKLFKPSRYYVKPDTLRTGDEIYVQPIPSVKVGDRVEVKLDRAFTRYLRGTIIEGFGPAESREANYKAILAQNSIEVDFEDSALALADEVSRKPVSLEGREDLRDELIFTIDGADAKDLDDAISLRVLDGGEWLLGVHIADVSEYVQPKTALDRAAMSRGTSVYFTDKVVPMLPPAISNGACSLNPNERKLALSAIITLSPEGIIKSCEVKKSVIISKVRGVYSEVNDLLEKGKDSKFFAKYESVYRVLLDMHRLYKLLEKNAAERGYLELERYDATILLDEQGAPTDIIKRVRGDAERLIEQFMLTANEGVAALMSQKQLPCVYRVHEKPTDEKLSSFATFAHNYGIDIDASRDSTSPKTFQKILKKAAEDGCGEAVSYIVLRTMAKARYSDINEGHFGLGLKNYCHFTSPIRRLSDLATHRMIKAVLLDGKEAAQYRSYARRAALAASETELAAMNAERAIDELYKCIYMEKFIGMSFPATITMVTSHGIFAELDNTCEGKISFDSEKNDIVFDERTLSVRVGGKKYSLADKINITVEGVNICRRTVDFSIK